jgi:adenylosuccinate synthase
MRKFYLFCLAVLVLFPAHVIAENVLDSKVIADAMMSTELTIGYAFAEKYGGYLARYEKIAENENDKKLLRQAFVVNAIFMEECEKCLNNLNKECYKKLSEIISKVPQYQGKYENE